MMDRPHLLIPQAVIPIPLRSSHRKLESNPCIDQGGMVQSTDIVTEYEYRPFGLSTSTSTKSSQNELMHRRTWSARLVVVTLLLVLGGRFRYVQEAEGASQWALIPSNS
jgi:hypothetical protein